MNNAYDLVVNFKSNAYQFYEWQKNDEITCIKSIPCIKVSDNTLKDFVNNSVKVSSTFLNMIKNKTVSNKDIKNACILFNNEIALAFVFDDDGNVFKKSNLVFDESDDIVEKFYDLDKTEIIYKLIKENNYDNTKTRNENKLITKIIDYLYNSHSSEEKVKYLYYECFNEYETNYERSYKRLIEEVKKGNNNVIFKLNRIISLIKK